MPSLPLSLFAASIGYAAAQYVNNSTIGSCADVDCPSRGDSTTIASCQATNRTYSLIGLESLPLTLANDKVNLTWTVGAHVYDKINGDSTARNVQKDFYLGMPPSLNLSSANLPYAGCAVFLYNNELAAPRDGTQGSCADTIGLDCLTSLLTAATTYLARSAQNSSTSAAETCQRVQKGLSQNFLAPCASVSGHESWNGVEAIPLTGPAAPQPPSPSANRSSTCHPTLPKSNDLGFVFGYNDTGTMQSNSTISMLYSVNLVLTLFWSRDGGMVQGEMAVPQARLTCLWPVDLSGQQLGAAEEGAAGRLESVGVLLGLVGLAAWLV